jgi:type II secretory pathway component PulF
LPTRVLLAVGQFGDRGWPYALASVPLVAAATIVLGRSPAVRRAADRWILHLPVVSRVANLVIFSRFSSSMATLLNSGVTLDRALDLSEKTVGNSIVADAVKRTRDRVQSGATLAEALSNTGGFPHVLIRMVRVGEASGDLAGMLRNCNEFFEREIPQVIRKALAASGPALIALLGGMVVWVALSIILPLMQLGSAVK